MNALAKSFYEHAERIHKRGTTWERSANGKWYRRPTTRQDIQRLNREAASRL